MQFSLLIIITFVACAGTFWSCFCRIYAMNKRYRKDERAKYVALMAGASAFGFQGPLFGEAPGVASALFACVVFAYMLFGMWRWKHGAPADAITGHGDLEETT